MSRLSILSDQPPLDPMEAIGLFDTCFQVPVPCATPFYLGLVGLGINLCIKSLFVYSKFHIFKPLNILLIRAIQFFDKVSLVSDNRRGWLTCYEMSMNLLGPSCA